MAPMDPSIVTEAAKRFGTEPAALTPLAGGHVSAVYAFEEGGKTRVLRIIPPHAEIRLQDVRAIQAWVRYLAAHGAPVPRPLQTHAGQDIVTIRVGNDVYCAVAQEKARGIRAETLSQSA